MLLLLFSHQNSRLRHLRLLPVAVVDNIDGGARLPPGGKCPKSHMAGAHFFFHQPSVAASHKSVKNTGLSHQTQNPGHIDSLSPHIRPGSNLVKLCANSKIIYIIGTVDHRI